MGVSHKAAVDPGHSTDTLAEMPVGDIGAKAKWMEVNNRLEEAAKLYEKLIKSHPFREENYNRLMIIYRKQKDLKNELKVIDTGIKSFEQYYAPSIAGQNSRIIKLSRQLSRMVGLTDKKGNNLFDSGPISKWKKRKELVQKKLEKT